MTFSNKTYDTLKWVAAVLLPAVGALYFALSDLWNLPKALEVVGTVAALDTFLGVLLGVTSASYNKLNDPHAGYLQQTGVDPHTGVPDLALTLTKLPSELLEKKTITLHVDALPGGFSAPSVEQAAAAPVPQPPAQENPPVV